jgi:hypothetical protein
MLPPLGHEITLQVDLATTVIALLGLVFSLWLGWRQSRVDVERLRQQRDTDIIRWGDVALAACCNAEMLLRPEYLAASEARDYERKRLEVLESLSCVIDAGRLYFPNSEAEKFGLEKEAAFRGKRHAVLDMLVRIYDLLDDVTYVEPSVPADRIAVREQAVHFKREFISRVQAEVDPRRRVQFLGTRPDY